jgi:hypothetical protein
MKTLASIAAVALALALVTAADAKPNTATTALDGTPTAGTVLEVTFTVMGSIPVVPYEYSLQNVCITGPSSGHYTIGQSDPIVDWSAQDADANPQTKMPVYLQSVPAESQCKVSLVTGNTVVKGSTVAYTVQL